MKPFELTVRFHSHQREALRVNRVRVGLVLGERTLWVGARTVAPDLAALLKALRPKGLRVWAGRSGV